MNLTHSKANLCNHITVVLLLASAVVANAADEQGLWAVWTLHQDSPDDHAGVVAACEEFAKRAPDDPLVAVTCGLAGWHLLQDNKLTGARTCFETLLDRRDSPLQRAASEMARAWLTRLDVPRMRAALRQYYLEHVGYPASLEELKTLPGTDELPLTDRWQRPWEYRLTGYRLLRDMSDQKYKLGSRKLGSTLELDTALSRPYASGISLAPVETVRQGAREVVRFESRAGGTAPPLLLPGHRHEGTIFAWMGERLVVLADVDHWQVLPKPGS